MQTSQTIGSSSQLQSLLQTLAITLESLARIHRHLLERWHAQYVSSELEDDLEEVGCHDMKCPITFALLMQPVEVHGKVSYLWRTGISPSQLCRTQFV